MGSPQGGANLVYWEGVRCIVGTIGMVGGEEHGLSLNSRNSFTKLKVESEEQAEF